MELPELEIKIRENAGFSVRESEISDPSNADEAFLRRLLAARCIDKEDPGLFLYQSYSPPSPSLLKDMEKGVGLIREDLDGGRTVALFCHDDVDGISGASVLASTLRKSAEALCSGSKIFTCVPNSADQGHGLKESIIGILRKRNVSLLITVDIGISDHETISQIRKTGIKVLVTDHHKIIKGLPPADGVINPLRGGYPEPELCGAGVAYKLAVALAGEFGTGEHTEMLLPLAMLGILADLSPMRGENRHMVARGLSILNEGGCPNLARMVRYLGFDREVDEMDIKGGVIPLLNAGVSSEGSNPAFRLLDTGFDSTDMETISKSLLLKQKRIDITNGLCRSAIEQWKEPPGSFLLFIDDRFHPTSLGAVSGLICAEYGLPVILVTREGDMALGEARAPAGIEMDWVDALSSASDFMRGFGGHRKAAGFAALWTSLQAISGRLAGYFNLNGMDFKPSKKETVDFAFPFERLERKYLSELKPLHPFGKGNPIPSWLHDGNLPELKAHPVSSFVEIRPTGMILDCLSKVKAKELLGLSISEKKAKVIYSPAATGSRADLSAREICPDP